MAELKYEILEKFGTLSTSKSGWELQLNFVQWGDNTPKFDLRTWSPNNEKMGKGITLTHDEIVQLHELLGQVLSPEMAAQPAPVMPADVYDDDIDDDDENEDDAPKFMRLSDID